MKDVLVDSNVLLDVASQDPNWLEWSLERLSRAADESILVLNPIIFAEVSVNFLRVEEMQAVLPLELLRPDPLPYEAAFLAGKCYLRYRRRGGTRRSPLPDFYIGAHAAIADYRLLTRDPKRYRDYFPKPRAHRAGVGAMRMDIRRYEDADFEPTLSFWRSVTRAT